MGTRGSETEAAAAAVAVAAVAATAAAAGAATVPPRPPHSGPRTHAGPQGLLAPKVRYCSTPNKGAPSLVRGPSRARIARSSSSRPALRQAGRHEPVEAPLPPSCTLSPRARHCPATLADPRTDLLGVRCRAAPARAPLLRFPLLAPGRCALTGPGPLLPLPLPAAPSLLPPLPAEPGRAQAEPSSGAELGVGRGRAGPGARNPALRLWSGGAPTGRVARAPQGAWVSEWRGCGPPGHWSGTPWCLSPEQFRAGCLCPTPRPWCGRRPQPMIYPRVECYNPIVRLHWASEEGCTRRKPCTDPDAPYGCPLLLFSARLLWSWCLHSQDAEPILFSAPFREASCTMSVSCGPLGTSLTQEILSSLGLADKTAAWGTLGTLRTFLSFSVDKDVQRLLKAIAGQGVDYDTIVDVLTNRSREQRQLISRAFQERTKQDLLKSLQAALSGNLEKIVVALLQPAAQFDAQELRTALKTSGSAEDVALEILATRAAPRLQACLAVYKHDFQVEAEDDIRTETNGILQDLLLALSKGDRESYSGIIDYNLEEQDVRALQQAGESSTAGQWVLILTQRSPEHLIRVFDQYRRCTGQELEDAIRNCFHGDAQLALISLASMLRNTALYFANKLHQALQETEPNFQVLMRVLISRSESDLLSIRAEFKKKFGKSLYSALQDVVRGDCLSALLALCRAEDI